MSKIRKVKVKRAGNYTESMAEVGEGDRDKQQSKVGEFGAYCRGKDFLGRIMIVETAAIDSCVKYWEQREHSGIAQQMKENGERMAYMKMKLDEVVLELGRKKLDYTSWREERRRMEEVLQTIRNECTYEGHGRH